MNDWTRKGPLPDLPSGRRASDKGGYRSFDAGSDAGSERGERRRNFEGDGKVRDFGNWERKGPLSPTQPTGAGPMREGGRVRTNDGPRGDRRQSPAWGEGRKEGAPRREFQERPQTDRQPTAPELDNQWRSRMKPDAPARSPGPTPDTSTPSSPAGAPPTAPAVRPKLNLAKRTVSEAEPSPASTGSDAKASPFGAAKPIDTAAREKEIEEKREMALRQKKEVEEKAREEKRAKEAAAKAEKEKEKPPSTPGEGVKGKAAGDVDKENGGELTPGTSYEILQRANDGSGDAEDANGTIVEDKAVKPKEIVQDPPKASQGAWRKATEQPAETTAENLEEEGWSMVPQKSGKNRRGGGQASRAVAS